MLKYILKHKTDKSENDPVRV